MKLILTILCAFFGLHSHGQLVTEYGTGLSPDEVIQMKNEYAEMLKSQTYLDMMANSQEFGKRLAGTKPPVLSDEEWNSWIEANISKTRFSSIAEAKEMRLKGLRLVEKLENEHPTFYQIMKKATRDQLNEICQRN